MNFEKNFGDCTRQHYPRENSRAHFERGNAHSAIVQAIPSKFVPRIRWVCFWLIYMDSKKIHPK